MPLNFSQLHGDWPLGGVSDCQKPRTARMLIDRVHTQEPADEGDRLEVGAQTVQQTYRNMVTCGKMWQRISEHCPLDVERPIEDLSQRNLAVLRAKVQPLAQQEQDFYVRVIAQPWFLTRFSSPDRLRKSFQPANGTLTLKSRDRKILESNGSDRLTNASGDDIRDFGATNFVYFCLEIGESLKKNMTRPSVLPNQQIIVRTPLETTPFAQAMSWHGDIYDGLRVSPRLGLHPREQDLLNNHLSRFQKEPLNEENGFARTVFYTPEAIKEGTVLQVILDSRVIPEPRRNELLAATEPSHLNTMVTSLSRTQVMVPEQCTLSQYQIYHVAEEGTPIDEDLTFVATHASAGGQQDCEAS